MSHAALITGASRGIGRGIALALAAQGHDLALAARSADGLAETEAAAQEAGAGSCIALAVDLADAESCAETAAVAAEGLGRMPDILVHCAGIALNGRVDELPLADWERSWAVNVTSAFVLAGRLVPSMRAQRWGRIVTIGSLYSKFGVAATSAYTSTKHAILGLTRVLSAELVHHGVTANTILPGWVDTEMVRGEAAKLSQSRGIEPDEVIKRFLRTQPLGRMVTVEEVGALVAYLCSDAAAPITGQALNIDGGSYQG